MGLKLRKFVYVSDRGQEFEVDEMATSHLLNALNHHHTQLHTVANCINRRKEQGKDVENLVERREALVELVQELMDELASRSLEDDAKREVDGGNRDHRY